MHGTLERLFDFDRTRAATDQFRRLQTLRAAFNELMAQMPPELAAASDPAVYNIVQLVYRSATNEGHSKDYKFSRRTMEEHWSAGRRDALTTLRHPEVLARPAGAQTVKVYDFISPTPEPTRKDPS